MMGLAQKKFMESHDSFPGARKYRSATYSWPIIQSLLEKGYFSYSDYYLAETLLKRIDSKDESIALFICYLSAATRSGHMCVVVEDNKLQPSLESMWSPTNDDPIDFQLLSALIIEGATQVPNPLVFTPKDDHNSPICCSNSHYYLQRYWHYEARFIEKLDKLIHKLPTLTPDLSLVNEKIQEMVDSEKLLNEQADAIRHGCSHPFTIITGGPGTGKTYTAGHLIRIYYDSLSDEDKDQCRITLAAPTGKAAANLQKSLLQAIGSQLEGCSLQAKTIHSLLLNKRSKSLSPQGFLHSNFLLIDECSMIDARMMTKLFNAIRPGTKVIFLGDKYQLPPVEVGSLFGDITSILEDCVVTLKTCLRADMQELVHFAQSINAGDLRSVCYGMENGTHVQRLEIPANLSVTKMQKQLLNHMIPHFKEATSNCSDVLDLLKSYQKYRALTPLRSGPYGVDTLNQLIKQEMSQSTNTFPIMITKNDYNLNLFNGETGLIIKKDKDREEPQEGDFAVFLSFDAEQQCEVIHRVPALLLSSFEYAYVMSVHKSQGSEFQHVLLILPEGSEVFGREVLYTAATRAKRQLTIWTEHHTVEETLKKVSERVSGIKHYFTQS